MWWIVNGNKDDGDDKTGAQPEAIRLLENEEKIAAIVEAAGGWPHINQVCREWSVLCNATWKIVVDYWLWGTMQDSRIDGSKLKYIAHKHGVCQDTVWRRGKDFAGTLAAAILKCPVEREVA